MNASLKRGDPYRYEISKGVFVTVQSEYHGGQRLDTSVEIGGKLVVAGSELGDFENALRDLLDRWRI